MIAFLQNKYIMLLEENATILIFCLMLEILKIIVIARMVTIAQI